MEGNFSHPSNASSRCNRLLFIFSFSSQKDRGVGTAAIVGVKKEVELREIIWLLRAQHQNQGL